MIIKNAGISVVYLIMTLLFLLVNDGLNAANVDLGIDVSPTRITGFEYGEIGEFSITVTNNGPEDAGLDGSSEFPIRIDSEIIRLGEATYPVDFNIDSAVEQECGFFVEFIDPLPGDPPGVL